MLGEILEAMRMAMKMDETARRRLVRMALLIIVAVTVWFAGAA
jgi:hypothetical protein